MTKYYFRILKTEAGTYRPQWSKDSSMWYLVDAYGRDRLYKWTAQWQCYRRLMWRRREEKLSKWSVIEEWVDE